MFYYRISKHKYFLLPFYSFVINDNVHPFRLPIRFFFSLISSRLVPLTTMFINVFELLFLFLFLHQNTHLSRDSLIVWMTDERLGSDGTRFTDTTYYTHVRKERDISVYCWNLGIFFLSGWSLESILTFLDCANPRVMKSSLPHDVLAGLTLNLCIVSAHSSLIDTLFKKTWLCPEHNACIHFHTTTRPLYKSLVVAQKVLYMTTLLY